MMSENYKDSLEKLSQKYKFSKPEYITIKSGSEHEPNYVSVVTINNETFRGQVCKTKKISEAKAALEALNYINTKYLHNVKKEHPINRVCILIDSDNLPGIENEITFKEISNTNLSIYMFMDKINYLKDKKLPDGVIRIISPDTLSNITDISMMTYTGALLAKNLYDIYFVATRDKFALGLVELIKKQNICWNIKEAHQITKINEIYKILDDHQSQPF